MAGISVIVPSYNVEQYIERCLNSILEQDFDDFEIIIVDDGSTDKTGEIADNYAKKFRKVRVIHKKNEGLGFARNTGIEKASKDYIIFIDSDDYIEKNMLSNLYKTIVKNAADVCYSDFFRDYGDKIIKNNHLLGFGGVYYGKSIFSKIIPWMIGGSPEDKYDDILGWGVWKALYSKRLIKTNNIKFHSEKEMISEDIIFQLDFLRYTKRVVILEDSYYHYCLNKGSLSTKFRKDRREKNLFLYKEEIKRLALMGIEKKNKLRADRLLIASARMNIMISVEDQSFTESLKSIKEYVNDSDYYSVIKNYPSKNLPYKQKIFINLLKNKMVLFTYLVSLIYIKTN